MKSGFVAILGMPNSGKSSILNAVVGQKVSIVSKKPQTTRNRILGIYNDSECQIVFCDTPGLIEKKTNLLAEQLAKESAQGAKDTDVSMVVIAADKGISSREKTLIEKSSKKSKAVVVVNKVDLVDYTKLFPLLEEIGKIEGVADVVPLCARTGKNLETLVKVLKNHLNEGEMFFAEDEVTDKSLRFMVAELIREKALSLLNQEIPHGIFVEVEKFEEKKNAVNIEAAIIVEKDSHKAIVIGAKGGKIKDIGTRARVAIEGLMQTSVYLKLFVKVREGWRDSRAKIGELK